jgi:hypothetical protein
MGREYNKADAGAMRDERRAGGEELGEEEKEFTQREQ